MTSCAPSVARQDSSRQERKTGSNRQLFECVFVMTERGSLFLQRSAAGNLERIPLAGGNVLVACRVVRQRVLQMVRRVFSVFSVSQQ